MLEQIASAVFWIALAKIVWVNILLSGDNAVVIALASRNLPADKQKIAIFYGSAAAIVLRVVLTLFAVQLLQLPWLKLIGAALLLWIGIQLLADEKDAGKEIAAPASALSAVRTILIADLVMSLDNVIAVAGAAESAPAEVKTLLLNLGLGLSIPLIIFGSTLLLKLMARAPWIVLFGAALLGFVAGELALTDPALPQAWGIAMRGRGWIASLCGAAFVVAVGTLISRQRKSVNA